VDARVNSTTKVFGGLVSFLSATLITLLRYQNQKVKLQIDGHRLEEVTIRNVAIGNGKYFGGGMMICPDAVMDDGIFQVTVVGDISRIGSIRNLGNLYKGSLQGIPRISFYRGKKIVAESKENILLDVDGEQPGHLPATFEIVPQALNVYIP
jgi:diacylglycerol kinase family enzyme